MKESKLQDKCIEYLKSQGIYHINIFGSGRTAKGAPDLICCINGRFVAFELKVEDNEMQPDQVIHKRRIERNGGIHYCPRSIGKFVEIVENISKGENLRGR